jgi:hypothetical protein
MYFTNKNISVNHFKLVTKKCFFIYQDITLTHYLYDQSRHIAVCTGSRQSPKQTGNRDAGLYRKDMLPFLPYTDLSLVSH